MPLSPVVAPVEERAFLRVTAEAGGAGNGREEGSAKRTDNNETEGTREQKKRNGAGRSRAGRERSGQEQTNTHQNKDEHTTTKVTEDEQERRRERRKAECGKTNSMIPKHRVDKRLGGEQGEKQQPRNTCGCLVCGLCMAELGQGRTIDISWGQTNAPEATTSRTEETDEGGRGGQNRRVNTRAHMPLAQQPHTREEGKEAKE